MNIDIAILIKSERFIFLTIQNDRQDKEDNISTPCYSATREDQIGVLICLQGGNRGKFSDVLYYSTIQQPCRNDREIIL